MKKNLALLAAISFFFSNANAQFLPGISTSNYNGVLGTFSNPANTLGQSTWDLHLFGLGIAAANENAKIKLSDIGEDNFVEHKLIGTTGYNNANLNLNVPAASLLVGAGKTTSFAFTSRGRVFLNADHIDSRLLNTLTNADEAATSYPYTLAPGNPSLVMANAITDYGFTWANQLWKGGAHYLKGGITVKYVSGVGDASINTNLAGTLDQDVDGEYISPGTGTVNLRTGGSVFAEGFEIGELIKFRGGGLGLDLGLTYEYRPQSWNNGATKKEIRAHGHIPYLFRFNIAVMDLGKVSYTPDADMSGNYNVHIPAGEKFYTSSFEGKNIDEASDVFDAYPQYFTRGGTATGKYNVALPTTLRLNFDYNIGKGFFVNLNAQLPAKSGVSMDAIKVYNIFSITPRLDGRKLGVFLPITINQLSGVNVGAALHLGPLYVGSGSILSLLTGGSKQADAFFGLRFGGLKQKKQATKSKRDS